MESLAYLHLAVAHELPDTENSVLSVENHKHWDTLKPNKFSHQVRVSFLSLLVVSSLFGLGGKALAQQILLKQNSEGPQVARVQQRLRELGYFWENATGYYGSQTQAAVQRFQQDYGLNPDGVVGDQTWSALFGTSVSSQGTLPPPPNVPSSRPYSSTLVIPAQQPTTWEMPAQQVMTAVPNVNRLTVGDRGPAVIRLQELLRDAGFNPGTIDGVYGLSTLNAVKSFQRAYNLEADGIAGERTLALLENVAQGENSYVVIVPIRDPETFSAVRKHVVNAVVRESRQGDYIEAGKFSNRSLAESRSYLLRSLGFDARVAYL